MKVGSNESKLNKRDSIFSLMVEKYEQVFQDI